MPCDSALRLIAPNTMVRGGAVVGGALFTGHGARCSFAVLEW
jgi:hypothetical protein